MPVRLNITIEHLEMLKGIPRVANTDVHLVPVVENTPREPELTAPPAIPPAVRVPVREGLGSRIRGLFAGRALSFGTLRLKCGVTAWARASLDCSSKSRPACSRSTIGSDGR